MRLSVFIAVASTVTLVCFVGPLRAQSAGIRITSPQNGTIVTPGQILTVSITPNTGTVLQGASAWILPLSQVPQVVNTAPFQVLVQVPLREVGSLPLIALAGDSQ